MTVKNNLFDFSDYRDFLRFKLQELDIKGVKIKFANAIGIQPAYLSQVLSEKADLSLEQADLANVFFAHNDVESEYLLLILQENRAATKRLKSYFQTKISKILEDRLNISKRQNISTTLTSEEQAIYYTSWLYSAIHMAVTIPELQNRVHLQNKFQIPMELLNKVLSFLLEHGLVIQDSENFKAGQTKVFLGNNSPHLIRHHNNWRNRAINSFETESPEELHYSGVFSLSKSDVIKIKKNLLETIDQTKKIIAPSKEEELYSLTMDWFQAARRN